MRVLVTGSDGYIGSVLCPLLRESGHDVVGLDSLYFGDCILGAASPISGGPQDIRDLAPDWLDGIDAVVHLAALSNDPVGNLNSRWTDEINTRASVRLAEMARDAGVGRFLFSSSCIMYGMSEAAVVDEDTPLDPQTDYARSKVESERAIAALADDAFSPVFIRNGTVYGLSPRMRLDTVLNGLMADAFTSGRVIVHSDGTPWRPVVHIDDLVRTFRLFLEAPREAVHNQAFNNGVNALNYRVIELAEAVCDVVPGARLEVEARPSADQRTYRADFTKFQTTFPDFRFEWDARSGARQLFDAFEKAGLGADDVHGDRFVRLRWLRHLIETGRVDDDLRWRDGEGNRR